MKAQSPLLGFNNNVRHKGRVFHIQTEDSGVKHPHVITHLFADGGRIIRSQKTSYAEYVGDEEMPRKVRALMQEQHKAMFIALRAGKFDHLLEAVPPAETPSQRGRAPMESTVSIEIGDGTDPAAVVHVAPGEKLPPGSPLGTPRPMAAVAPPAAAAVAPAAPPVAPRPAFEPGPTLPAIPRAAPVPGPVAPAAPPGAAMPSRPPSAAGRPASIIPPAAKPLAPASVPPPPMPPASDVGFRQPPRKNSGLLAALGALSSGNKAPSLGASPPSVRQPQRPPMKSEGAPASSSLPGSIGRPPVPASAPRAPAPSSLDLDLEALERAAEQGNSPVYRQVRDFPPPPQAVRSTGTPALRSLTPDPSSAIPNQDRTSANPAVAAVAGRYAPSRPASIFGNAKPQEGSSIFGEDLISEKSLDEVILSYLAEDLEPPPKK